MTIKKKSSKRQSKKKVSLTEFRAWLDGIEEMQADDWAPDANQWATIRNKINLIIEPKPEIVYVEHKEPLQRQHQPENSYQYSLEPQQELSSLEPEPLIQAPAVNPELLRVPKTPEKVPLPSGSVVPSNQPIIHTKTPVLTADGTLKSSFE